MITFEQFDDLPVRVADLGARFTIKRGEDDFGLKGTNLDKRKIELQHFQYVRQDDHIYMTQETYDWLSKAVETVKVAPRSFQCVQNRHVRIVEPRYPVKMSRGWRPIHHDQKFVAQDGFAYMTQATYDWLSNVEEKNAAMRAEETIVEVDM